MSETSLFAGTVPLCVEDALLVQTSRTILTAGATERIKGLLRETVDWSTLIRRADEHHVTGLLYRSLRQMPDEAVPLTVRADLDRFYRANARHNMLLALELLQLQELLNANNIPFISFKGCTLASTVYGDLALRRFGDLDILLREQDIPAARNLLRAKKYQLWRKPEDEVGPAAEPLTRWNYHYTLQHSVNGHSLELHWQVAPKYYYFPLHFNELMDRSAFTALVGAKVRVCAPEDLLQILCMHAAKHGWVQLGWAADIAELVRATPDLDWDLVTRQMSRLHSHRSVALGLWLAQELLDADLPQSVQRTIQQVSQVGELAERVYRRMFAAHSPNFDFEGYALQLQVRDTVWDRLIYIRVKQPMMDPAAVEPIPTLIPARDVPVYALLRAIRFIRIRLLRPVKRLWQYFQAIKTPDLTTNDM